MRSNNVSSQLMRHFLVITGLITVPSALMAQIAGSGSIQGTITDPSGAAVPGATVTAADVATKVSTTRQTTAAGYFVISPLNPGEYTVTISASGFESLIQQHVVVNALGVVGLNLTMKIGSTAEVLTVTAAPPQLDNADATVGQTMQNNVYTALPLAMRNGPRDPTQFINLVPGVAVVGGRQAAFNGGTYYMNEIYLEGLPMTNVVTGGETRNLSLGVSVEAVEQFQVETSSTPAMYQGQGVENFVLKSGTDQFHGSVYEYFRNTDLDARGFFQPVRPVERQNQFGVNVGGPIKKNRIFFFGSYDGYRFQQGQPATLQSLPSAAERNGDFSALPTSIYDPNSTTCVSGGVCRRQVFAGNSIPTSRLSPVAKSFQSYLPATINSNLQNNYLASIPATLNNDNTTDKVDFNLSDKNRLFGVFSRGKSNTPLSAVSSGYAGPLPYTNSRAVQQIPTTGEVKSIYVIKPNLLNQLSFAYTRLWIPIINVTQSGDYPKKAGLTGLPAGQAGSAFPLVTFSGPNSPTGWLGGQSSANWDAEMASTLQDNVQFIHGRHSFTAGFQMQWLSDNFIQYVGGSSQATFSFSNLETAGFSPTGTLLTTTGNSYASYLLGAVDSSNLSQTSVTTTGARYKNYAWYLQDDFKVNSRLTLNLGLRYDIFRPFQEVANRWSYLNPDLPNAAADGYGGALEFAGYGVNSCHCATPIATHYTSWGPRLGLAYRLNDKTVIRTGYAIMYSHMGAIGGRSGGRQGTGKLGYDANVSLQSLDSGITPAFYWDQGFPAYQQPPFFNPTLNTGFNATTPSGGSIGYGDPVNGALPPRVQNWNFGIQRALTSSLTLGVAYTGSVSHHLSMLGQSAGGVAFGGGRGIFSDQILPQYLGLGNLLRATANAQNVRAAQALFPGISLPYPDFRGTIGQMLLPFPQYASVADTWPEIGNGKYNSLQATLRQRLSAGLVFTLNYTFSKELDDILGTQTGVITGRTGYNNRIEKAIGITNVPHSLSATFVYQLPFGGGHRLGSSNPVVRSLVSNWQLSGIVTYSTGLPLGVITGTCNTPYTTGSCYVSYNPSFSGPARINGNYGDGNVLGSNSVSYIDKNAFVDPAPYTFGNTPRTSAYGLTDTNTWNQDLSVRREFSIWDRVRFAIQGDIFNVPNNVRFTGIGINIDSANFGKVSTQGNSPRQVQLAARFTF